MNLVLIHGRDQQGQDKDKLKQLWIDTLEMGLSKSNLALPRDVNIIFPFYGNLLDDLSRGLDKSLDGAVAKGPASLELLAFEAEMYQELAANASITQAQIVELSPQASEKGPLNWAWVQAILRALEMHTGLGEFSIRKFTHDVYAYLNFPSVQDQINQLIKDCLQPGPTVIVGHSLGSIVGYTVLQDFKQAVPQYITIGSPLGLRSVTKQLPKPLQSPHCIKGSWYNAYDDGDYVALNPLSSTYFNVAPAILNSAHVINQTQNKHGIEGYLNDALIAERIYNALLTK